MQLQSLQQELAGRSIALSIDELGSLKCKAPKGAMTPDLANALREHKAALLATLTPAVALDCQAGATPAQGVPLDGGKSLRGPVSRQTRTNLHRPSSDELAYWQAYYGGCSWYVNPWQDGPFSIALEHATAGHIPSCVAFTSNRLIRYYERCQALDVNTERGHETLDPRQFTERLRAAYQGKNTDALVTLLSSFHDQAGLDEIEAQGKALCDQGNTERNSAAPAGAIAAPALDCGPMIAPAVLVAPAQALTAHGGALDGD